MSPAGIVDPYVPDRGSDAYDVSRYEIDLDYRVATNRLAGHTRAHVVAREPLNGLVLDLSGRLRVAKVRVNGAQVRFRHRQNRLTLTLARGAGAGAALVVDVVYAGSPGPGHGRWGEVGWEELTDGVLVAGQPDGAGTWFPCNDHPRHKARFSIAITTENDYTVVANGTLAERITRASRTRWRFETRQPMATYLATVQIGRYEQVELVPAGPGRVRQAGHVPAPLAPGFRHDFQRQPQMMDLFCELFGPYPFDAYEVVVAADDLEIPLEAQGVSVFGANLCDGSRAEERLVAHELAHQWFGNSVTVRSWQHIWLNEGFACYAEWLWSPAGGGPATDDLARRYWADLNRLPQDLRLADPGPDLMFDDRLYKRGALALHALRLTIGDAPFFALLRRWCTRYRHGCADTGDFIELAAGSGVTRSFWQPWLQERALPRLPAAGGSHPA